VEERLDEATGQKVDLVTEQQEYITRIENELSQAID
jgi:hypothetical protein